MHKPLVFRGVYNPNAPWDEFPLALQRDIKFPLALQRKTSTKIHISFAQNYYLSHIARYAWLVMYTQGSIKYGSPDHLSVALLVKGQRQKRTCCRLTQVRLSHLADALNAVFIPRMNYSAHVALCRSDVRKATWVCLIIAHCEWSQVVAKQNPVDYVLHALSNREKSSKISELRQAMELAQPHRSFAVTLLSCFHPPGNYTLPEADSEFTPERWCLED